MYAEHWLGLDTIHRITNQRYYSLRLDLMDWDRRKTSVEYEYFHVGPKEEGYPLYVAGLKPGTIAGDGLLQHSGHK